MARPPHPTAASTSIVRCDTADQSTRRAMNAVAMPTSTDCMREKVPK